MPEGKVTGLWVRRPCKVQAQNTWKETILHWMFTMSAVNAISCTEASHISMTRNMQIAWCNDADMVNWIENGTTYYGTACTALAGVFSPFHLVDLLANNRLHVGGATDNHNCPTLLREDSQYRTRRQVFLSYSAERGKYLAFTVADFPQFLEPYKTWLMLVKPTNWAYLYSRTCSLLLRVRWRQGCQLGKSKRLDKQFCLYLVYAPSSWTNSLQLASDAMLHR